jgi:hypothetical protein
MLVELVQKLRIISAMISHNLNSIHGTKALSAIFIQLAKRNRTHGVFMICMAMSGNGCRIIGTVNTIMLLLMVVLGKMRLPPREFVEEVAGQILTGTVAQRFV